MAKISACVLIESKHEPMANPNIEVVQVFGSESVRSVTGKWFTGVSAIISGEPEHIEQWMRSVEGGTWKTNNPMMGNWTLID